MRAAHALRASLLAATAGASAYFWSGALQYPEQQRLVPPAVLTPDRPLIRIVSPAKRVAAPAPAARRPPAPAAGGDSGHARGCPRGRTGAAGSPARRRAGDVAACCSPPVRAAPLEAEDGACSDAGPDTEAAGPDTEAAGRDTSARSATRTAAGSGARPRSRSRSGSVACTGACSVASAGACSDSSSDRCPEACPCAGGAGCRLTRRTG